MKHTQLLHLLVPTFFCFIQTYAQTVEPIYSGTYTRVKCPGPGMKFTQGLPLRILADAVDIDGYQWLETEMEAKKVEFYVDGVLHDTDNYLRGYNHFEALVHGLNPGFHALTTKSYNYGGVIETSPFTVNIEVEPMPVKPNTINLTGDIVLTGSTDLNWQDVIVYGNGYLVSSSPGWSGDVLIQNSFITGLGVTVDSIPTAGNASNPGIDVSTNGGAVTIENSIFEWTGASYFYVDGTGNITVRQNEFRANNFIPYVSWDPDRSPIIQFMGGTTGTKVFQGNNVGAGYLNIYYMDNWLIGGDVDSLGNIFIGPRTGIRVENSSNLTIRGNYSRHDYYGGWSQGYNFRFNGNASSVLCEHNVIRQGSWPVQSLTGIFRYNLVAVSGHEWIRTLEDNTEVYRNVFINPEPAGYPNAGCWIYDDQVNVKFYNNTFDGGGNGMSMFSPAIAISDGSQASLIRNNLFTNFVTDAGTGLVDRYLGDTDLNVRVLYTDFNCFYNPDAGGANNYGDNIVAAVEGTPGFGGNDLGGINGQVNPMLEVGIAIPYQIEEDQVWNRTLTVSCVLAEFRYRYTPHGGSPLSDAGDPASGTGVDIGAIETPGGLPQANDLFGMFGPCASFSGIPSTDELSHWKLEAWPNPFYGSTNICCELPNNGMQSKKVNLSVYSMDGKLVSILVKNQTQIGDTYTFNWKAEGIPAGIYMVRLQLDDDTHTLKVILME